MRDGDSASAPYPQLGPSLVWEIVLLPGLGQVSGRHNHIFKAIPEANSHTILVF